MNEPTRCCDGCGAQSDAPEREGWTCLQITGRYRCPKCVNELQQVNQKDKDEPT